MNFWLVLGVVGSVASVIGLILPIQQRNLRLIHLLYGAAVAVISSIAVWYYSQNNRIRSVEREANVLTGDVGANYTHEGFILAALAFLEKNRDLYPDAYQRAKTLCPENKCIQPEATDTVESVPAGTDLDSKDEEG